MQDNENKNSLTINLNQMSHPYEDKTLTEMQTEAPILNTREPFNDAVRFEDTIVGYQRNRTLSDYPKRLRPWVRLYAIAALLLFVGGVLWDVLQR